MTFKNNKQNRHGEKGNVLFLILIAVALFAALSYAVTQSSRSGGGDANKETNLISSAQITQYPASVRTSIIRMIVSDNTAIADLEFNSPSDFGDCTTNAQCVFHPSGGNATYATAPPDVMADGQQGEWTFNGDFEIVNVGLTTSGSVEGQEVIAFLPGIKQAICSKINDELGLGTTIPNTTGSIAGVDPGTEGYMRIMDDAVGLASTNDITIGTGGDQVLSGTFDGQAFGCFQNNGGEYVYFHVLVEQ